MTREQLLFAYYNLYLVPWPQAFGLGVLGGALLVRVSKDLALRFGVVARPGRRMSHDIPTPRLGGVGIAGAFFLVLLAVQVLRPWPVAAWSAGLVVGSGYAFVGGLLDDVLDMPAQWKFLFQAAAAGAAVMSGTSVTHLVLPGPIEVVIPQPLAGVLAFAFIVLMMNAYNFLDGMDGQAALFGLVALAGLGLPLVGLHVFDNAVEILAVAGLAGGLTAFFYYNWPGCPPKRKTFMGDCGSQFVGFVLAVLALRLNSTNPIETPLAAWLILFAPFLHDVLYTLLRRLARRENIFQAHRSHLYQRLLIAGWTHGQVLALNAVLYLGCFALAYAYRLPWQGHSDAAATRTSLLCVMILTGLLGGYTLLVLAVERAARRAVAD